MSSQLRIDSADTLSVGQAARRAGVSSESVRVWIKAGRLPATVTPLGRLVSPSDLDAVIAQREVAQRERRPRAREDEP